MDIVLFHSVWTIALLVLFVGIWIWAWSAKRKPHFDAAARLVFDDEMPVAKRSKPSSRRRTRKNG